MMTHGAGQTGSLVDPAIISAFLKAEKTKAAMRLGAKVKYDGAVMFLDDYFLRMLSELALQLRKTQPSNRHTDGGFADQLGVTVDNFDCNGYRVNAHNVCLNRDDYTHDGHLITDQMAEDARDRNVVIVT